MSKLKIVTIQNFSANQLNSRFSSLDFIASVREIFTTDQVISGLI